MHLKDFIFAVINFLLLFGALFLITRKMIFRMFKERKEKIAGEIEKARSKRPLTWRAGHSRRRNKVGSRKESC